MRRMLENPSVSGRSLWLLTVALLSVAGCRFGESAEAADESDAASSTRTADEPPSDPGPRLSQGTRLSFRMAESVSTETHGAGSVFRAELAQNALGDDGEVILPAGTPATGVVTESRESGGPDDPAVLAVAMESLRIGGVDRPIEARVVDADVESGSRASGGETAAKIAVGTAAGALLGRVLGDGRKDVLVGAGVGAAAGTVLAVTTQAGHASIPKGSTLTVQLGRTLALNQEN